MNETIPIISKTILTKDYIYGTIIRMAILQGDKQREIQECEEVWVHSKKKTIYIINMN